MTSNLSAFPFIANGSEATPELWNRIFSQLSSNLAAVDSSVSGFSGDTLIASSGTFSLTSNLSIGRDLWVKGNVLVGQPASVVTRTALTLGVRSDTSDYIHFADTSGAKSSYILGSHVGGTADGLNLWDQSGSTMIASFSKQSSRFYSPIVGPIFDVNGAVYNVKAYGALGDGITDDTGAIQLAESTASAAGGGSVFMPPGVYKINSTLTFDAFVVLQGAGKSASIISTSSPIRMLARVQRVGPGSATNAPAHMADFRLNGNNIATTGLYSGLVSYAAFRDIFIDLVAGYGVVVDATQNTLFQQVTIERAGHGWFIANGAGNITMLNCHQNDVVGYFLDSDLSTSLPAYSTFGSGGTTHECSVRHCIWEQQNSGFSISSGVSTKVRLSDFATNYYFLDGTIGPLDWTSKLTSAISIAAKGFGHTFYNYQIVKNDASPYAAVANGASGSLFFNTALVGWSSSGVTAVTSSARLLFLESPYLKSTLSVVDTGAAGSTDVIWTEKAGFYHQFSTPISITSVTAVGGTGSSQTLDVLSSMSVAGNLSASIFIASGVTYNLASAATMIGTAAQFTTLGVGTVPPTTSEALAVKGNDGSVADLGMLMTARGTPQGWFFHASDALTWNSAYGVEASGAAWSWYDQRFPGAAGVLMAKLSKTGQFFHLSGTALEPTMTFSSETSLGFYRSGVSTMAPSYGTFNLATSAVRLSMRTLAASSLTATAANTNVAVNEVVFTVGGASGVSLAINSGGTTYYFNSDGSAKNT